MRVLVISLILLLNLVLQSTVFGYIEIIGVKPNSALLIIVTYAMLRGDLEGAIVGFFSGLLQDVLFGRVLGLYAMLGLLTGYICGKPFKDFYRENYMIPLILSGISCICYEFAFYFIFFLFQGNIDLFYYFSRVILPETVYTIVIAIPIYRIMYGINLFLEEHEKHNRRLF